MRRPRIVVSKKGQALRFRRFSLADACDSFIDHFLKFAGGNGSEPFAYLRDGLIEQAPFALPHFSRWTLNLCDRQIMNQNR